MKKTLSALVLAWSMALSQPTEDALSKPEYLKDCSYSQTEFLEQDKQGNKLNFASEMYTCKDHKEVYLSYENGEESYRFIDYGEVGITDHDSDGFFYQDANVAQIFAYGVYAEKAMGGKWRVYQDEVASSYSMGVLAEAEPFYMYLLEKHRKK